MKTIVPVVGVMGVLLGGLWLLQGLGVLHVRPILCVADCAPIQGPSPTWAITGLVLAIAGILAVFYSLKRRTRR